MSTCDVCQRVVADISVSLARRGGFYFWVICYWVLCVLTICIPNYAVMYIVIMPMKGTKPRW